MCEFQLFSSQLAMFCLKAEALDDDRTLASPSSSPSTDRSNTNGAFVLPVNWGNSIHRYLRKAGKISRRSHSSGDGSLRFSDFKQETKMLDQRSERDGAESKSRYKYELEQDVKKLQQQLQEEINLRLALSSAVEHSDSPFLESPCKLPDKAQELLDSLAILEITVSKLEQESVSLQYLLNQERNERHLAEFRLKKSPSSAPPMFNGASSYFNKLVTGKRGSNNRWFLADSETLQTEQGSKEDDLNVVKKEMIEDLSHCPNGLSEEMVKSMRNIFLFLAKSAKTLSSESMPSPSSPLGCKNSVLDSPILASLGRSPMVDIDHISEISERRGSTDPYKFSGNVEWSSSIGAYSTALEVAWFSVGKNELEYATMTLRAYRGLVERLAKVDMSCMGCNEKLAFWINIYNALIMHAFLAYGVPTSDMEFSSLIQKSAYCIGGLSFSAADIEYISLKMQRPLHRPHLESALTSQKSKISRLQGQYAIDHPEPLVSFALSCGMHSSPAVRIFKPENVNELLKRSLRDYVQASIGISEGGKLLVPELIHNFAKGAAMDESLFLAWVCGFLSPQRTSAVNNCLAKRKHRFLSYRSFTALPFDTRFRILFLVDEERELLQPQ